MSSCEPGRPEYERRVVRHLRRTLIDGNLRVHHRGCPVAFEDVRLEGTETGLALPKVCDPGSVAWV